MKNQILPESFLRCVSPEDRKMLGQMTAEEGIQAFRAREEKELHKLIWQELNRRDVVVIHSRMDKRTTNAKGIPDFCFVMGGVPFAIEAKGPFGGLSEEQERTLVRMDGNGWNCYVVRSFDEFRTILEQKRKGVPQLRDPRRKQKHTNNDSLTLEGKKQCQLKK